MSHPAAAVASAAVALMFGPDDEDEFESSRDALVRGFEASGPGAGFGWVAEQLLTFKWAYLDGDLATWSDLDVRTVLLELYPAKVTIGPEQLGEVIRGFGGLFRYFAALGFMEDAMAQRLVRSVEANAGAFAAAMADDSRFGMGKRIVAAMAEEGFDPSDQASVEAWMADFNDRPLEERDRILGPALIRPSIRALGGALLGRMPPVVLAPAAELQAAAEASALFQHVRGLVTFVGDGRKLTDRGNLTLADARQLVDVLGTGDRLDEQFGDRVFRTRSATELPQLDLAFRVALGAGVLLTKGRMLRVGPNAALLEGDPLEAVYGLLLALLQRVGPTTHHYAGDRYGWGWFAEELDRDLPRLLIDLYRGSEPVEVDELGDECWEDLLGTYDLDDVAPDKLEFHHTLVSAAVRRALHRLEDLGIVTVADVERCPTEYGGIEESGGTVALSPLGVWVMQHFLSTATDAPVAGALADLDASELLARVVDLPEDVGSLELDTWVAQHGAAAAALLVDALPVAEDTGRAVALRALLRIGPSAADEVARLADHPDLASYVTVWRVDALVASPQEMDVSDDPERFVRLLHAVLDLWSPHAVCAWLAPAAGADGIDAALNRAWRVRIPETETVLAVLGEFHPDKAIAKSARKALFRFRSSGGASAS
ncbi:MAG: hypothetical protein ACYDD4_07445 [Acidimicrobiales bacterium]